MLYIAQYRVSCNKCTSRDRSPSSSLLHGDDDDDDDDDNIDVSDDGDDDAGRGIVPLALHCSQSDALSRTCTAVMPVC